MNDNFFKFFNFFFKFINLLICFKGIFTINKDGVRTVVGMYDYGIWDADACSQNDEYIGFTILNKI